MADSPIIQGILQAERGDHRGDSLDGAVRALTRDLNKARKQAEAEGQDDAGIFAAMREAWKAYGWEIRYAHLLAIAAQWFTISAQHNADRVPLMPRLVSSGATGSLFVTIMLLGAPELERALDHELGVHPESEERKEGEACGCFDELIYRMKLEPYFDDENDPAKAGGVQKGEA